MRTKKTKDFYRKLAEKYNLSVSEIENIDRSQFQMLLKVLKECDKINGHYPIIRIPYLGMFYVPYAVRENIKKKYGNTRIE